MNVNLINLLYIGEYRDIQSIFVASVREGTHAVLFIWHNVSHLAIVRSYVASCNFAIAVKRIEFIYICIYLYVHREGFIERVLRIRNLETRLEDRCFGGSFDFTRATSSSILIWYISVWVFASTIRYSLPRVIRRIA